MKVKRKKGGEETPQIKQKHHIKLVGKYPPQRWCGRKAEVRKIEKDIEKKLVERVKSRGGIAPKWVSPGYAGVPDRLVFLPKGKFAMAELKAPGEVPRPLQKSRHRFFRKLGFKVYVIDGVNEIDEVLDEIEGKEKKKEKKQKDRKAEKKNREK